MLKPLPNRRILKFMRMMIIYNGSKHTILNFGYYNTRARCHGHARPRCVAHGRMPMTSQPFMSFHILVFYFCISRKYDVSEILCLGLSDMKCLKMYYSVIRLVVNFSLPKVIYCEPLLFLSCLLI